MRLAMILAATLTVPASTSYPKSPPPRAAQLAHLNHFYAVVDQETAQAIAQSPFLRQFANFEVRTTTGTNATWTGRYLRGKTTYVELFAPADLDVNGRPAAIGSWGIAVSGDRRGDLGKLQKRIEAAGHKTLVVQETRKFGDKEVPWFKALTAISRHGDSGDLRAPVTLWAMEYEPSYFALPEADKEAAEGDDDLISRERYQPDLYAKRMMRDVTRVELAVTPSHFRRIEPMLLAAGFRLRRSGDRIEADGADTDFGFRLTASQQMGVRRIIFGLNSPIKRHVETIGRSTLTVGPGAIAVWTFHPGLRATTKTR